MQPLFVPCINGLFAIPDELFEGLRQACPEGTLYIRQDEDVLTISPTRIADARKRHLNQRYRIPMFRTATQLAVIDMVENIRIMAVQWRTHRSQNGSTEDPRPVTR